MRLSPRALMVAALVGLSATAAARADRIVLKGGTEIKGHLKDDPEKADRVQVFTGKSARPLTFPRSSVLKVIDEPDALDDYDQRKAATADTAEAQYGLGLWCEKEGLNGLAPLHFQRAIVLDPTHAGAHKKLGHVERDGVWMTYDESKKAQGLVLEGGKWISREESQRKLERKAATAEYANWVRQIRTLHEQVQQGNADVREAAEKRLGEIDDPAAVAALVEVLGAGDPASRAMLVRLLDDIPGPEARQGLVAVAVHEPDATVWDKAMAALAGRKDPDVVNEFVRRLGSQDQVEVGRAARALERLDARTAVPRLITALKRVEIRYIMVPGMAANYGPLANPVSFTSVVGQNYVANVEPVVGPGVVAYSPMIGTVGQGVTMQGTISTPATERPAIPREVPYTQLNSEVLGALEGLTGRNFGYDVAAWKRWLTQEFQADPVPRRRVVEP